MPCVLCWKLVQLSSLFFHDQFGLYKQTEEQQVIVYLDHAFHVWKWALMQVLRVQIAEHHQFLLQLALHYLPQVWSKHQGQKTKYQIETGQKNILKRNKFQKGMKN